jgi:hypothetical protein
MESGKPQESKNPKPVIHPGWITRYSVIDTNKKEIDTCKTGKCACLSCYPLDDILN